MVLAIASVVVHSVATILNSQPPACARSRCPHRHKPSPEVLWRSRYFTSLPVNKHEATEAWTARARAETTQEAIDGVSKSDHCNQTRLSHNTIASAAPIEASSLLPLKIYSGVWHLRSSFVATTKEFDSATARESKDDICYPPHHHHPLPLSFFIEALGAQSADLSSPTCRCRHRRRLRSGFVHQHCESLSFPSTTALRHWLPR